MLNKNMQTLDPSASFSALHVGEQQLESIAQCPHVWIRIALQLVPLGNHLDRPAMHLRVLSGLEAKEEVSGMLGVYAEGVRRPSRVSLSIGLQPLI
jgi:hypothetical protein